jgi:hypothetical protein
MDRLSHAWAPLEKVLDRKYRTVLRGFRAVWALKTLSKLREFGLWEALHLRRKPKT